MAIQNLLRINEVTDRTRLSRSTIYNMMKAGTFPKSRRAGRQSIFWLESEINDWLENLPVSDPEDWHSPNRRNSHEPEA